MNLIVCKNYEEMSLTAAAQAADIVSAPGEHLISFPGGDTPLGMVREFSRLVNKGGGVAEGISRTRYVQLDEWVGLGAEDAGSCARFNQENLLNNLRHPFLGVHLIDGLAASLEAECGRLNAFIDRHGPLDLSVLGIGLNGHLGFNEEGVDFEKTAHIIPLSETTKKVMRKYFDRDRDLEYGITQGIRHIMAAKKVILIANGAHKAAILKRAFTGPVTNAVPASILQRHGNCTVIVDRDAAVEL
ncbi:MAG: glucosamine-6-phosphate deaminase [Deltaproteobacteria bacterium]|jgi:glucosamine-6-phosphate deaminase|nr:glucosamine-6-phosphate deaminase [Deltaproteobacteria bacterium]